MSSLGSLSSAVSALMSSQTALNTTAHNLSNVDTKGYVRQQVLLEETNYSHIGLNGRSYMSVGTGTDVEQIRQVRDIFLDSSYREETGRMGFYEAQAEAVEEIETILGETEGEAFSVLLNNFWESLNELEKNPEGLETRASFVQNSVALVERSELIMEQLNDYQNNMNTEIINNVARINEIGHEIDVLNDAVTRAELSGGNANDFRDARNLLVDELSSYVDISYREDADGGLWVSIENVPFVISGNFYEMSTTQAEPFSAIQVPYWEHLGTEVFNLNNPVGPEYENDIGNLKGMVIAVGTREANYTDLQNQTVYEDEVQQSVVMQAQAQFDNLIHGIVTMINDIFSPNTAGAPAFLDAANAPYGLDGTQGIEIFVRKSMDRYDAGTGEYNVEDPANDYSLYSAGNIKVNPDVLADYDLIALSSIDGYYGDTSVIDKVLKAWEDPSLYLEPGSTSIMNFSDYYTEFIGDIGGIGSVANQQVENQDLMSVQIDNQRQQLIGVSSDEEMGNMMKYQHAYNAAARVVTVVDQMMEQIVTSLGLVGR